MNWRSEKGEDENEKVGATTNNNKRRPSAGPVADLLLYSALRVQCPTAAESLSLRISKEKTKKKKRHTHAQTPPSFLLSSLLLIPTAAAATAATALYTHTHTHQTHETRTRHNCAHTHTDNTRPALCPALLSRCAPRRTEPKPHRFRSVINTLRIFSKNCCSSTLVAISKSQIINNQR